MNFVKWKDWEKGFWVWAEDMTRSKELVDK
jgi:hypothetical protein